MSKASQRASVVLLHASASSARQWDGLARALAPDFDVHAIDLHGHGSRAAWFADAPLTLADDAALLDPLFARGRPLFLVGHSYGGAVACEAARRHPDAVAGVAVYEPVLFKLLFTDTGGTAERDAIVACAQALRHHLGRGDALAAARHFIGFWSGADAWTDMTPPRQAAAASRMHAVASHFDALFAAADPRRALARLPLLALTGQASVPVTRRIGRLLEATLPRAVHAGLPGLGHMGPLTHPAIVDALIAEFLHRHAARPRSRPHPQPPLQRPFIESTLS
jgi:pimeloyl-ACP methyl ester carboxylesterase